MNRRGPRLVTLATATGGIRENTHEAIFEENINFNERYVVLCTVTEGTQRHPTNEIWTV